jgi:hypothetical protein
MIAHEQRETSIVKRFASGKHGDAILEMPLGIVGDVHDSSARGEAGHDLLHALGLIANDNVKPRDACVGCSLQRSQNERLAEDGLKEFGLARTVLESVPIAGREDDRVPYRKRRTWSHDYLESLTDRTSTQVAAQRSHRFAVPARQQPPGTFFDAASELKGTRASAARA